MQWARLATAIWKSMTPAIQHALFPGRGLQNISTSYYLGRTEGTAQHFQKIRHITWPLLSPTTFL
jgi:ABC-type sugar transport system permease subunit